MKVETTRGARARARARDDNLPNFIDFSASFADDAAN